MEIARMKRAAAAASNGMYGMGLVRSTSFGRKRVSSFSNFGDDDHPSMLQTPLKRLCSLDSFLCIEEQEMEQLVEEKCLIQDLPQELLIRILCGVEHDDLKRLFFVSKSVREATVIAKKSHFAFSTPRKTLGFKNINAADDGFSGFNTGVETPKAPKRTRVPRSRLVAKKLADISVDLFDSGRGHSGGGLFSDMETE